MNVDELRRAALALPGVIEADHHGIPSFRVDGRIFATLHLEPPRLMVKLDPEDQHNLTQARPGIVEPVPGAWGRGSTFVAHERAEAALIATLLAMAHAVAIARPPKSKQPA